MTREEGTDRSNFENLLNIIFQWIEPGILGELIDFWTRRREMQDEPGASYSARYGADCTEGSHGKPERAPSDQSWKISLKIYRILTQG